MAHRPIPGAVLILLALALPLLEGCGRGSRQPSPGEEATTAQGDTDASQAAATPSEVILLFPGIEDDLLHAEKRTVVPIESPEERVKQCLEELFRGPSPGLLAAAPEGARVREAYILSNGTAYVDLSPGILALKAGSQEELQTVYAIVDTVALNVRQVARLAILVDGAVRETLAGHVFIGEPLVPNFQYVEDASRPASSSVPADSTPEGSTPAAPDQAAPGEPGEKAEPAPTQPAPEQPPTAGAHFHGGEEPATAGTRLLSCEESRTGRPHFLGYEDPSTDLQHREGIPDLLLGSRLT